MAEARAGASAATAGEAGAPPRSTDWTLRLFESSGVAPVWTGLGVMVAYGLVALLYRALAASLLPASREPALPWIWELVNGLLVALPLTANAYALRGALRDLRDLRPCVALGDAEWVHAVEQTTTPPRPWLAALSGAGVVLMGLVVLLDPGIWVAGERPGPREPALYWAFFHNAAAAYCFGRMLALEATLTLGFARIAERARVDLLDLAPLAPLARRGQRSALLWILLSSCISLFWFSGQPSLINGFTLALVLAVVATAFALPLSRARRGIAAAKRAELLRVNRLLERERAALVSGGEAAGGRMADLVAWRGLVEGVREWPVSAPTLARSGLFVLLGVGSWLGGAVVERLLEAIFPN